MSLNINISLITKLGIHDQSIQHPQSLSKTNSLDEDNIQSFSILQTDKTDSDRQISFNNLKQSKVKTNSNRNIAQEKANLV